MAVKLLSGVSSKLNYLIVGDDAGSKLGKGKEDQYDQDTCRKMNSRK